MTSFVVLSSRLDQASKNQNPRKGIETEKQDLLQFWISSTSSKNQNPRKGIETEEFALLLSLLTYVASKNQNPRKGIETLRPAEGGRSPVVVGLQKTKIPARGLKPQKQVALAHAVEYLFKKPKSPQGD